MPTPRTVHTDYLTSDYGDVFRRFEGSGGDDYPQLNILFAADFHSVETTVAQNIAVLEWDDANGELTFSYDLDDNDSDQLTLGYEDIIAVTVTDLDLSLTPDAFTQFPTDATVAFDYTTARGTQKRVTGLTPAFVRPSERHAGKNILVGFTEQEDGTFARKTFRTDRITNLVRDNA
jgi:hypothetical protein